MGLSKFHIRIVPSPEKVANEFNGIALSSRSTVGQGYKNSVINAI